MQPSGGRMDRGKAAPMSNNSSRLAIGLVAALTAGVMAGCSKPIRPGFAAVTGEVAFDGTAIPVGYIQFEPQDKKLSPESAPITAGRYSGIVRIGPSWVRITASRPSKKISPDSGQLLDEPYIPERYNMKTELSAEIAAEHTNTFDFRLTSSADGNEPEIR